jgi:Predicted membrane protein (DUF2207)
MTSSNMIALIIVIVVLLAMPIGWFLGRGVSWVRMQQSTRRWRRQSIVYAAYEAPNNLSPAEVAFLYDRRFGEQELLAMLFDLELRQKITLKTLPDHYGEVDFHIRVISEPMADDLRVFEQELLVSLIAFGATASWHAVKADNSIWKSTIEHTLEEALIEKGYLQPETSFWQKSSLYLCVGALLAVLTVVLPAILANDMQTPRSSAALFGDTYADLRHDMAVFVVFMLWTAATAVYAFSSYVGISAFRRAMNVQKGTRLLRSIWPQIEGFRQYLVVVEQDRIAFENKTAREAARQSALAYAVGLNLTTRWEARFVDAQP